MKARARRLTSLVLLCFTIASAPESVDAADMRRLKGEQIKARFADKEFTDETHWSFRFARTGKLFIRSMGTRKELSWNVKNHELCMDDLNGPACYEAWSDGTSMELRLDGTIVMQGVLVQPEGRT